MPVSIDYYFTSVSPFAYLGHDALVNIAAKHGKSINFKPFNIAEVWKTSGSVPLGERSQARQNYRLIELQRTTVFRNICMNVKPKHFPTNPTLADNCICALILSGQDASAFSRALGRAVWEQELDIADHDVVKRILIDLNMDAENIIAASEDEHTAAMKDRNTRDAVENDAIGAPAYVYNGEVFWGQDRLEYLAQMIASGRSAFSSNI